MTTTLTPPTTTGSVARGEDGEGSLQVHLDPSMKIE